MLTLNSKALKIGNKWILPVQSGGVIPPTPTVYQVTTSATHGTVTASPTEGISGTEITLSNTPDTHYHFDSYTITGATLKNGNQFDIADSDVSVVGNFFEDTKYTVTCTNDGNGTISASPTSNYSGSTVTLSNTPNTGYGFDKYTIVSGTGASISGNILTIGTSDVTVRGDFVTQATSFDSYELELTSNANGLSFGLPKFDGVAATPTSGMYDTISYGTGTIDASTLTYITNNIYTWPAYYQVTKCTLTFAGGSKPSTVSWENTIISRDAICTGATLYGYIGSTKHTLGTGLGYSEAVAATHTITL
ncbi:MAG: hypothetical protein IIZ78_04875 [Clostridiales bacterium]|nr:hypothetical protein [Clostridiales bacterium]